MAMAARIVFVLGYIVATTWYGLTHDTKFAGFCLGCAGFVFNALVTGIAKAHREAKRVADRPLDLSKLVPPSAPDAEVWSRRPPT